MRMDTEIRQWHSEGGAEAFQRQGQQQYTQQSSNEWEMSTSVEGLDTYEDKVYFDQCGWVGYDYGSDTRLHFRFSDSHVTGEYVIWGVTCVCLCMRMLCGLCHLCVGV